jgi:hypothetical protein
MFIASSETHEKYWKIIDMDPSPTGNLSTLCAWSLFPWHRTSCKGFANLAVVFVEHGCVDLMTIAGIAGATEVKVPSRICLSFQPSCYLAGRKIARCFSPQKHQELQEFPKRSKDVQKIFDSWLMPRSPKRLHL